MNDAEDQISPRAIKRCDYCAMKNFAMGGRTDDGRCHQFYEGETAPERRIRPKVGKRAWCGLTGPEHLLRVIRIICAPVVVDGETVNLCQRCAFEVSKQQREAEVVAA